MQEIRIIGVATERGATLDCHHVANAQLIVRLRPDGSVMGMCILELDTGSRFTGETVIFTPTRGQRP